MSPIDPREDAVRRVQEMERMLRHLGQLTRLRDALRGLGVDAIRPQTLQTLDRYIQEESLRVDHYASDLHRSWSRSRPPGGPDRPA